MGCFVGVIVIAAAVVLGAVGAICLKGGCKKDDEKSDEKLKE